MLDNAIKFTDEGQITLGYEVSKDSVLFYVEDTGIGLSQDKIEIIFELFRKVEDNKFRLYRGTGLGLALGQHIVNLMGGEIKVISEEAKGSRFYFSLPLNDGDPVKELTTEVITESVERPLWPGKTILLVEDDPSNLTLLNEILKPTRADILLVVDGRQAVDIVFSGKKIDLIIMDIKLPGFDGYEATRQIRERFRELPIIAHTAYAMAGDKERSIDAGCSAYIAKPTNRKQFLNMISKFLKPEVE